jgi:transcriptional regulator with XRE-family HTH domain
MVDRLPYQNSQGAPATDTLLGASYTRAKINPAYVVWARESAGLTIAEIAKRLGVAEDHVRSWEDGSLAPTAGQVQLLAMVCGRLRRDFYLQGGRRGSRFEQLPSLGFAIEMEERRYAKRESRRALAIYDAVHAQHPELTGIALYEKITESLAEVGAEAAHALVRAAEQSFAEWPNDRELTFRDVVHYLCFDGFSRSHDGRGWTLTSLGEIADSVIPKDL